MFSHVTGSYQDFFLALIFKNLTVNSVLLKQIKKKTKQLSRPDDDEAAWVLDGIRKKVLGSSPSIFFYLSVLWPQGVSHPPKPEFLDYYMTIINPLCVLSRAFLSIK